MPTQSLSDRQQKILYHIVHDYITSATPIGSEVLSQRYKLGVSPATIRNEMGELADLGYLAKQHISSGRIPTVQAYRFFVDRISQQPDTRVSVQTKHALEFLHQAQTEDYRTAVRDVVETLSSLAHTFTIGYAPQYDMVWRDGIEYFLEEPEFSTHHALRDATIFTERLHDMFFSQVRNYLGNIEDLQIFIGDENPFQDIEDRENYSMMVAPIKIGKQKYPAYFALVGPLRMAYDNNISLLDYIMHEQD